MEDRDILPAGGVRAFDVTASVLPDTWVLDVGACGRHVLDSGCAGWRGSPAANAAGGLCGLCVVWA